MFEIENITLNYEDLKVLDNLSLRGGEGEFICLFGPSGVGKSSILNVLAGVLKPASGSVRLNKSQLAYVFQEPRLLPWQTVEQNMEMSLYRTTKDKEARLKIVRRFLPLIGLEKFKDYYPDQLSGGMKQRVSLGRAFVTQPDLLLLDEPFSGLDDALKMEMQDILLELKDWHSCTTVMVTHDIREAIKLSNRMIILDGRPCHIAADLTIDSMGNSDEYIKEVYQHIHKSLISA